METSNINAKCILLGIIYLGLSQVQATEEPIYQDYLFSPIYSKKNESLNSSIAAPFETQYSNYWVTTKIKESIKIDEKVFAVGHPTMRDGKNTEYTLITRKLRKQKKDISKYKNLVRYADRSILVSLMGDKLAELTSESDNQRFYSNDHGAFDYLYCIEKQPLFSAALFKNKPFLFHITAKGNYTLVGEAFDFVKLHIYSPNTDKLILSQPLMLANYRALSPDVGPITDYYFPWTTGPYKGLPELSLATKKAQGRKHYAKLFIQDFDKNNKLDIIIWHREYASARRDDKNKKGFYLDKERFEWLEENATSDALTKRELSVKAGHELLKKYNVWWKDGWPNKNRCDANLKPLPYMMYIKDDAIGEPMGKTVGFGY